MAATVNLRLSPTATLPLRVRPAAGQTYEEVLVEPAVQYDLPATEQGKLLLDSRSNWTAGRLHDLLRGLYTLPERLFRLVQPGLKLHVGAQPTQFGETSSYVQGSDTITLARHMSPEDNTPLVLERIFDSMWANIKHPTSSEADAKADFLGQMRTMHRTQRTQFNAMVLPHAKIDPIAKVDPADELLIQLGTRTERLLRKALESDPSSGATLERLYKRGLEAYVGSVTDKYTGISARELTQVIRDADALDMQPGQEGVSNRLLFQFIHPRTGSNPPLFQSLFKQLMMSGKASVISLIVTDELRAAVRDDFDAMDLNVVPDPEQEAVLAHFVDLRAWVRNHVLGDDDLLGKIGRSGTLLV